MISVWEQAFFKNIGTYISLINRSLESLFPLEPLDNHIRVLGGYAFKSQEYKNSGVPIIRISDFNHEKIDLSEAIFYEERKEFERFALKEGDILIAMTGGTIGKLAIVQKGLGKLYLNQRVGRFNILNEHEFEKEYVYWLARGVQDVIKKLAWGGAQPNVSSKQIEKLTFPFPNKIVQKNIINFLNDLKNNKIEDREYFNKNAERLIYKAHISQCRNFEAQTELQTQQTLLSQLRQAILQEAVQGKLTERWRTESEGLEPTETGSALLTRIRAEKAELIRQGKLRKEKPLPPITDAEKPFELPEGWVWCRLGEVKLRSEAGKSLLCAERPCQNSEWGIIKMSAISSGIFLENENKYFTDTLLAIQESGKIETKDFLITRASGSPELVGKSVIVPVLTRNLLLNDKTIRYTFPETINSYFVNLCNNSRYGKLWYQTSISATSTTMKNITREQINSLPIPLPSASEQNAIVAQVERLLKQVSELEIENKQQQAEVGRLMQAVLREAFAGKEMVEIAE